MSVCVVGWLLRVVCSRMLLGVCGLLVIPCRSLVAVCHVFLFSCLLIVVCCLLCAVCWCLLCCGLLYVVCCLFVLRCLL